MHSCEYCEILKNAYFGEHMRTTGCYCRKAPSRKYLEKFLVPEEEQCYRYKKFKFSEYKVTDCSRDVVSIAA